MAHRVSKSHHVPMLRTASALLAGALLAQAAPVPVARAQGTPATAPNEPKREPRFLSREWRMARFADFDEYAQDASEGAALDGATALFKTALSGGSLEEYGEAVVSAVADAYVPGLSKMFYQQEDPLAVQTQILLDAIKRLETTMFALAGSGWAEFRTAQQNDIKIKLEAARAGIRNWNLTYYPPDGGWATSATDSLYTQITALTHVLKAIQITLKSPGSAEGLAAYPHLSLLEVYTEVMQLYTLTLPNLVPRQVANDQGVDSLILYEAASDPMKQSIDTKARVATLDVMEATFEDALTCARQISDIDPFRARANWMVSATPRAEWFYNADCDEDTELVFDRTEYVIGPAVGTLPYPGEFRNIVFMYKSNSMNMDYTTAQQNHCLVGKDGFGWWSTYDGLMGGYSSVANAVNAHREGAYNQLLRTGWGPFAIVLDKWWLTLRDLGLRNGLRPALALDNRLADYLVRTGGQGATFPTAMSLFSDTYCDRNLSKQERVLFIDYALEYGPEALAQLFVAQQSNDKIFFRQRRYTLDDHVRFITDIRTPSKVAGYYRSLNAARMLPLL